MSAAAAKRRRAFPHPWPLALGPWPGFLRRMSDAHDFLRTLAIVLSVAGITTVIFQRLKQPVVFGYLFAGMIVGPHVPIPIVVDVSTVQTLAETGVILLLFSLGLEFSLRKLIRVGPRASIIAVVTFTNSEG